MAHYVITHPFITTHREGGISTTFDVRAEPAPSKFSTPRSEHLRDLKTAAWRGHRSGPFTKLGDAEQAAVAALATGKFYQVEIVSEGEHNKKARP